MDKIKKLSGVGVALITPFKKGEIDFQGYENVINHTINGGVDFILPLGSTGESALLSSEEKAAVLAFAIKSNKGRVPLVAGNFGGNNTVEILNQIKAQNFEGIDAILSASPEYLKPGQEGIFKHYMALAECSPVPIIIYNVPGRTSSNVSPQTVLRLANASKKFIGLKAASGDLVQATQILRSKPDHFFVSSGDDPTALAMISIGGSGCISVLANVFPKEFTEMIHKAILGDFKGARKLNNETFDLHHHMYVEGNPVGVKAAAEILGLCSRDVRLPLVPMSTFAYEALSQSMALLPS